MTNSVFTDPIAALEEAQWLANATLRRYGIYSCGAGALSVRLVCPEAGEHLEIVYPTTRDYIHLRWVDKN